MSSVLSATARVSTEIAGALASFAMPSPKGRLEEQVRRNAERREMAAREGYCPQCGAGPMRPSSNPDDLVRTFRCDECRSEWTVTVPE